MYRLFDKRMYVAFIFKIQKLTGKVNSLLTATFIFPTKLFKTLLRLKLVLQLN